MIDKNANCNNCRDYNKCAREDNIACEKHAYNIDDRPDKQTEIVVARAKTIVRVKYLLEKLENYRHGSSIYSNINELLDTIEEHI